MSIRLEEKLKAVFASMPVVAILRHVKPDEAVAIGHALFKAGIRVLEVPLNSPNPYKSIQLLRQEFGDSAVVGAGTVINIDHLRKLSEIECEIIVTPNTNAALIKESIMLGMIPMPGFATPTEAFAAHAAGARYLKLFPASVYGTAFVKALGAILSDDVRMLAVGGVGAQNAADMFAAGIQGIGVGTELYRPGDSPEQAYEKGRKLVDTIRQLG